MEKKRKYASLVNAVTRSLFAILVVNVLLLGLLNISIFSNSIPVGSSLLFSETGPDVIPVRSFVILEQTNSINLLDCIPKTSVGEKECKLIHDMGGILPFTLPHTLGSGTIVGHKENSTYILTAAHVCVSSVAPAGDITGDDLPETVEMEFPTHTITATYSTQTMIFDFVGNEHQAEIVASNVTTDVCIMRIPGIWGLAVPIAKSGPPIGTMVQNMAAPLGIWAPGMVLRFDGYFSGVDMHGTRKLNIYTIPVAGGSSGSPVLYNGKIISIIVMSHRGFNHMGIGVRLEDIQKIMDTI